jgi:solute carrier family 35, member E1
MDIDTSYIGSRSTLAGLVISNGLAYTCYNTMSFLVLTRTNMVTHAILNCMRRVFIIVFTCYYFDVKLSNTNLAGVGIAVAGVVFFGIFKSRKQAVKNI